MVVASTAAASGSLWTHLFRPPGAIAFTPLIKYKYFQGELLALLQSFLPDYRVKAACIDGGANN